MVAVAPCRHCAGTGFIPREFGGEVEFGAEMDPCVCQQQQRNELKARLAVMATLGKWVRAHSEAVLSGYKAATQ